MKKSIIQSKVIFVWLTILILFAAALFACGEQQPTQTSTPVSTPKPTGPQYGGILKVVDSSEGPSIGYPIKIPTTVGNRRGAPAIEMLFSLDNSGKLVPQLATGYKEDVATKSLTISLQKNVKFHDGTNFSAEAVKWNLDNARTAKFAGTTMMKTIDIVDDSTIRITLTDWDSTVLGSLAGTLGMMISPAAYNKNGADWCMANPVGTGPFQFVSWTKDVKTIYKKFDGYWQKGKPYLDGIEYSTIVDVVTRELSFKAGEAHVAITLDTRNLVNLEKEGFTVTRRNQGSGAMSYVPDSANQQSPFSDVRVRQAAQYAIDTNAIVKGICYGEAEATNQLIYKAHWAYNPSIVGYPYNPTKAKELLAQAGYPNGFKTVIHFYNSSEIPQSSTAVQGFFKAVGIDADLDAMPLGRYQEMQQNTKWEGLAYGAAAGDPDVTAQLNRRFTGPPWYINMIVPDDYVKTIKSAIIAPNFETKQKLTQEAMKLMIDKYCLQIPLYCKIDSVTYQKKTHDHGFMGSPNTGIWAPENAWLDK